MAAYAVPDNREIIVPEGRRIAFRIPKEKADEYEERKMAFNAYDFHIVKNRNGEYELSAEKKI